MKERVVLKEVAQLEGKPIDGAVIELEEHRRYLFVLDDCTGVEDVRMFVDGLREVGIKNALIVVSDIKIFELVPEE